MADRRVLGAGTMAKRGATPTPVCIPGAILFAACERLGVGENAQIVFRFWYEGSFTEEMGPKRFFRAFATGEELPTGAVYCKSATDDKGQAWHLYELFEEGL
jgi:hypothetical protein